MDVVFTFFPPSDTELEGDKLGIVNFAEEFAGTVKFMVNADPSTFQSTNTFP